LDVNRGCLLVEYKNSICCGF